MSGSCAFLRIPDRAACEGFPIQASGEAYPNPPPPVPTSFTSLTGKGVPNLLLGSLRNAMTLLLWTTVKARTYAFATKRFLVRAPPSRPGIGGRGVRVCPHACSRRTSFLSSLQTGNRRIHGTTLAPSEREGGFSGAAVQGEDGEGVRRQWGLPVCVGSGRPEGNGDGMRGDGLGMLDAVAGLGRRSGESCGGQ